MNDPHVESLTYRLEIDETLEFVDPPLLEKENADLRLRLAEDSLTVWPKAHYASEEEAKLAIEPYLRAWEAFEAIRCVGRRQVRFVFVFPHVIDRDPPPPGSPQVVQLSGSIVGSSSMVGVPTVISQESRYPEPPEGFVASPEVEFMLGRYEQYLRGREPLLAMAYACLTRIEHEARHTRGGGNLRRKAALEYGVDEGVLRKLGYLTTFLGDEMGARKVAAQSENRPPKNSERRWIEGCVLVLIRRAGEQAADPQRQLPQINMADLPRL